MTIVAWRIVKTRLVRAAFSGEGARRYGGRWNSPGVAVVYAAQSQSLAALELLARLKLAQFLSSFEAIPVGMDSGLIERVDVSSLPKNWQAYPAPHELTEIGDKWVASGSSCVLQVPSVIIPAECNFLLNPRHADFVRLKIGKPTRFRFDSRLLPRK